MRQNHRTSARHLLRDVAIRQSLTVAQLVLRAPFYVSFHRAMGITPFKGEFLGRVFTLKM